MMAIMVQVLAAIFENGVFKPDALPALSENTRVRLVVETVDSDPTLQQKSWDILSRLWNSSRFDSGGDRLNRDQLHERH